MGTVMIDRAMTCRDSFFGAFDEDAIDDRRYSVATF
jgi:hypothetical protein